MNEITWNKKLYSFPQKWDEMTAKQYVAVTRYLGTLLFHTDVTEKELYARRILALRAVMNVPFWKFKKVLSGELVDLLGLLDFTKKININAQLLPEIKINHGFFKRMKLIGPKTSLTTSSFDEFIMADTYFVNISSKSDINQAYFLFAMLYRPERKDLKEFKASPEWNGDTREPFNTTKCKARVDFFKKYLPKELLVAVIYFYWGFRETNLLTFTTLFPKPVEGDEGNKPKKSNSFGWADTRLELSGHKFGNYKETGKENWLNIIFDMHREQVKANEREKKAAIARLKSKR